MNFLKVFILLRVLYQVESSDVSQSLSIALHNVGSEIFIKLRERLSVVFYGNPSSYAKKAVDKFLIMQYSTVDVKHYKNFSEWDHRIRDSSLIVLKTLKDAKNLFKFLDMRRWVHPKKLRLLVYVEEIKKVEDLAEIPYEMLIDIFEPIWYSYFLIETKKEIQIFTLNPFNEGTCGHYGFHKIAEFNKKKKSWKNGSLTIEEKFLNFHGCMVVFAIGPNEFYLKNFYTKFLQALSEKANMKGYIQYIIDKQNLIPQNGKNLDYHVRLLMVPIMALSWNQYHVTASFGEVQTTFVMTPGEKYSSYEKMILPFDIETWTYLGITFVVAFLTILLLKFMPKKLRDVVVGSKVQHPVYNVIGTFYGISQVKDPKFNSARILLVFFIFFCLIFRTAYQGVLFEMMTSDMRKDLPKTIDDLYVKNFTIVIDVNEWGTRYTNMRLMIPKTRTPPIINITTNDTNDANFQEFYAKNIQNASSKLAFHITDEQESNYASKFKVKGVRLEQNLYSDTFCIGVRKHSFHYHVTNQVTRRLTAAGILQNLWANSLPPKFQPPGKVPEVLKVEDLEFGFVVWLVAALGSTAVFLIELIAYKILIQIKHLIIRIVKNFVGKILILKLLSEIFLK